MTLIQQHELSLHNAARLTAINHNPKDSVEPFLAATFQDFCNHNIYITLGYGTLLYMRR